MQQLKMATTTVWVKGVTGNTIVIDIYKDDGTQLVTAGAMIEAGISGMYYYSYTNATDGVYGAKITDNTTGRSLGLKEIEIYEAGTSPTVAEIVNGVWNEQASAHTTAGTFGKLVQTIKKLIIAFCS